MVSQSWIRPVLLHCKEISELTDADGCNLDWNRGTEDLKKWHTRFKPNLSIMACQGDGIKTDIADIDCYKITKFRKKSFLTQMIERLFIK